MTKKESISLHIRFNFLSLFSIIKLFVTLVTNYLDEKKKIKYGYTYAIEISSNFNFEQISTK